MKRNSKKKVEKLFDDGTQRKEHYKLYKAGKLWLVAGVVSIAFGASELARTQEVHADTNAEATSEIANSGAQNTINQSTVTIASNTDSSAPQSEAKEPTKAVTSSASTSAAVVADTQAEVDELKNTALTAAPKDDNGNLTKPVSVAAMSSISASDSGSTTSADANITDLNDIYKNDSNWTLTDKTANISVTTNDNKYKITLYAYSQINVVTGVDRPLVSVVVQSLEDPNLEPNTYAFTRGSGHTSRYFYVDSSGKMTGFGTTNVADVAYYVNENAAGGPKLAKVMTSANGIQIAEEVQIKLSGSISHSLKFFNKGTTVLNNVKFGVMMDTALNTDDNIPIYADGDGGAYITNGALTLYASPSSGTDVYAGEFGKIGSNNPQNSYAIVMNNQVSAAGATAQSVLLSNVDTTILYESSNEITTFSTGDVTDLSYAEQLFVGKEPVILQNVLVQHELADGTKIADDTTVQGQLGDTITISADNDENFVIDGYELVDPNNATYTITGDGAGKNTVTLVYKQQTVDVQVKFVDKDNKVLATDLATGAVGSEIVYDTSTLMSTLPELANYRLASNQDSKVSFIVTNNENDNVITVHLVSKPVFNVDENNNGQTTITGTTEPGSEVKITDGAGTEHTVTADDKGDFTIPNVVVDPAGEDLTVTVTDPNGNETTETVTVPEDTTAPALDVTAGNNDSGKTTITGTTEPGATVVVTDGNGKDYTATAGDDGSFSIPDVAVNPAGDTLNVVATDLNGNTTPTTVTVNPDTTKPTVTVDPGTNNNGETTITGTTEPGSEVKITDGAGTEHTVTADDKGDFTIPNVVVDPAGEDLTVTVTDPNGNETTETVTVPEDTTAPALDVTAGNNDSGKTTITGTTEPGATVVVTDGNGKDYTATAGDDGSFNIPDVAVNPAGDTLNVVATDLNGNTTPTTVTVNPDTTKPTVTVDPGTNNNGETTITGTTEPGSEVKITDGAGTEHTVTADDKGDFTIPNVVVDPAGEDLTVTVTDPNGNETTETVTVPEDTAAPALDVTAGTNDSGKTTITGTTEPGATVVVTDGNGKDYTATAGDDGSFSIPDVAVNPAGDTLNVVATDLNGNTTPTTVTVNPDTTKPTITVTVGKNVGAKTSITGVTEPGATVTLIDHNGMKQTVIADGSGNFILPEVAVDPHGEKLTITATDRNGNAVNKVVDVPAQDPVTVEVGPAKPGDTIQITDKTNPNGSITIVVDGNGNLVDENGNVLGKLDSNGMATIALPNAIQGDIFEVTVIPTQQEKDSTDESAKSSSNSGKKEQMLPQTDEKENQAAVIGLTLLTSMLSFIGFKKKKAK